MKPRAPAENDPNIDPLIESRPFNPLHLIGFVLLMLLAISLWLRWYTGAVSMPRYCKNPSETLYYLEKVLTEERPAQEGSRRPYLIAAKLIYIIPQQRNEPVPDYLRRLETRITEQCR